MAELFEKTDWTESSLAAALREMGLKTNQSTISRLLKSPPVGRSAHLELALAIENVTSGLVRAEEVPMHEKTRNALLSLRIAAASFQGSAA